MSKRKERCVIPLKTRVKTVSITVCGTAFATLLVVFANNFVVDGEFIVRGGSLNIQGAPAGTHILLDSKLKGEVRENGNLNIKRVKSGKHTLIATKNAYWPWVKEFQILQGETLNITPLIIPKEASATIVESVPEHLNFYTTSVENDSINIWSDGQAIYVRESSSTEPIVIFSADYIVRALALYPNRSDTLLVAAGDMVFALDIDQQLPRNFLPIYTSTAPTFAIDERNGNIFIKDSDSILKLEL